MNKCFGGYNVWSNKKHDGNYTKDRMEEMEVYWYKVLILISVKCILKADCVKLKI